jgi:hypothetical protein
VGLFNNYTASIFQIAKISRIGAIIMIKLSKLSTNDIVMRLGKKCIVTGTSRYILFDSSLENFFYENGIEIVNRMYCVKEPQYDDDGAICNMEYGELIGWMLLRQHYMDATLEYLIPSYVANDACACLNEEFDFNGICPYRLSDSTATVAKNSAHSSEHISERIAEFIKPYVEDMFDPSQLEEIKNGIIKGLSKEQISLLAKPDLSVLQMAQIRIGLTNNKLSADEVKLYASKNFSSDQMAQIRRALSYRMPFQQITEIAHSEYTYGKMREIIRLYNSGIDENRVRHYLSQGFSQEQLFEINCGISEKMTEHQISIYAKPEFTGSYSRFSSGGQMREIRYGLSSGIPEEDVMTYAVPEMPPRQMAKIREKLMKKYGLKYVCRKSKSDK